jgi:prefoldin subunit 5
VLRGLENDGLLVRIGYGLYAKAKKSALNGQTIPVAPLPTLALEALTRLGVKIAPSKLETEYNAGQTTQVPTGRQIAVKGRISRKIGFGGAYVSYEPAP